VRVPFQDTGQLTIDLPYDNDGNICAFAGRNSFLDEFSDFRRGLLYPKDLSD